MPAFNNPLTVSTFLTFVEKIFSVLEKVALAVLAVVLVYAGYLFSSAHGEPEKLVQAKNAIFWSVVGAGIIFLGRYLARMIIDVIP